MRTTKPWPLIVAYVAMLIVIFVLPFFTATGYSIIKNTTSQLGAQLTPNAWLMNIVFIGLGAASIVTGWRWLPIYWFHRIVLTIFGVSLILASFFRHVPLDLTLPFDAKEDSMHSLFASLTGFSFTIFAVATAYIQKPVFDRVLAATIGVTATLLSILMFYLPDWAGIWQRLIFMMSFGWMIYTFGTPSQHEKQ